MISPVRPAELTSIAKLFSGFEEGHSHSRKKRLWEGLSKLSSEAKEFLSFLHYFLSLNRTWKSLDPDRYMVILPTRYNSTTAVEDFIELLRYYGAKVPNENSERILITFLNSLTKTVQHFFLEILSRNKSYTEVFYIPEVREELAKYPIDSDALYSGASMLKTPHGRVLQYPVITLTLPDVPMVPAILYKDGYKAYIKLRPTPQYPNNTDRERAVSGNWLGVDKYNIQDPKVVIYGMLDYKGYAFYPIDYFESLKEYKRHRKETLRGIKERQEALDRFLDRNFLLTIKRTARTICYSDKEVPLAIGKAMHDRLGPVVHFCDFRHTHYDVTPQTREGAIGALWKDGETALGFEVWCNARPINSYFDFSGGNNGLLYNPRATKGRHAVIHSFEFEGLQAASVSEILWHKRPYKKTPTILSDGSIGYLERCPFCLRDNVKPHVNGICDWTVANWRSMYGSRGHDNWFSVSPTVRAKREAGNWEPEIFERLVVGYKHFRLVCDPETGMMMFKSDPHMEELFKIQKEGSTTPEYLREWYRTNYGPKGGKSGNND